MLCRDWIRSQFRASYKGVPFEVEGDAREFGRRNALHQYPGRETWDVEDMGIGTKVIHVQGFIGGDDADLMVSILEAACSSPGPGLLMLPNRPPVLASAQPCVSNWEADRQGVFTIQLEFIQAPLSIGGLISITFLAGAVSASVSVGAGGVGALFSLRFDSIMRRFSPAQFVPAIARDASATTIGMVADALDRARRLVVMSDARAGAAIEILVRQMRLDRVKLAYQGQKPNRIEAEVFVADEENVKSGFAGDLQNVFDQMAKASTSPDALADALLPLTSFEAQTIDNPYDLALSVRAEKGLTAEVAAFVRRLAIIYFADAKSKSAYASRGDAVTARADIASLFDNEVETINDVDTEASFLAVRDAAVNYLSSAAAELPALVYVDCKKPMPAAALACLLYNDATRDQELWERNHAEDPLFMPMTIEAVAAEPNRRGL